MSGVIDKNNEYLNKDLESSREYTRNLANSLFPNWKDLSDINVGNFMLDSQNFIKDVLGFYLEKTYNELNITYAKTRRGIKALANLGEYKERMPYASKTMVNLHCEVTAGATLTLPKGTIVKTSGENKKEFQLLADAFFTPLITDITIEAEYSKDFIETFQANGSIWENFILSKRPFLRINEVLVDGEVFTKVDNFMNSTKDDKHFIINITEDEKAVIVFGNGVRAKRAYQTVEVNYSYTYRTDGYIEKDSLLASVGTFDDTLGNSVQVTTTGNDEATHSRLYETVNEIRFNSIKSVEANKRCFNREDYETAAYRVGGVARCLFLTADEVTGLAENKGVLFLVPVEGGVASTSLINDVQNVIDEYKPPTSFNLSIQSAIYKSLDIEVVLYFKDIAGYTAIEKSKKVFEDLQEYFNPLNLNGTKNEKIDFGFYFKTLSMTGKTEIPLSDIMNIIRDSEFVLKVDMTMSGLLVNGSHNDISLSDRDFPYFKRIQIIDGDTGTKYEYFN